MASNVHIAVPLTNFAAENIMQNPFTWSAIYPIHGVKKSTDKYKKFTTNEAVNYNLNPRRSPDEKAKQYKFDSTDATYTAQDYSLRYFISKEEEDNADSVMQLEKLVVAHLQGQIKVYLA